MSPVGRPRELDDQGVPIDKVTVNVTIPVRLKQFLDKEVKNRSELFTKIVEQTYRKEICNKCYSTNVEETSVGHFCKDCSRYGTIVYYNLKHCSNCNSQYKPKINLPVIKTIASRDGSIEELHCDNCTKQSKGGSK
jgi:ribosomal protein L40E